MSQSDPTFLRRSVLKRAGMAVAGVAVLAVLDAIPVSADDPATPTLRQIADQLGVAIGTTVDGTEGYRDPRYQNALTQYFSSMAVLGPLAPKVVEQYGWGNAEYLRGVADRAQLTLHLQPAFYPRNFPDALLSASDDAIMQYVDARIDHLLALVRKTDDGYRPTYLTFANEAVWLLNGKVGWYTGDTNPLYRLFAEGWMAEVYVRIYNKALGQGLSVGKDLVLLYNDSELTISQAKSDLVFGALSATKASVASKLGIPIEQVQLDIGLQLHLSNNPKDFPYIAPPPDDALQAFIGRFSAIGGIHLTEFDVKNAGQDERMQIITRILGTALATGNIRSVMFWNTFRFNGNPSSLFDYGANGLFTSDYTPTDSYEIVRSTLGTLLNR